MVCFMSLLFPPNFPGMSYQETHPLFLTSLEPHSLLFTPHRSPNYWEFQFTLNTSCSSAIRLLQPLNTVSFLLSPFGSNVPPPRFTANHFITLLLFSTSALPHKLRAWQPLKGVTTTVNATLRCCFQLADCSNKWYPDRNEDSCIVRAGDHVRWMQSESIAIHEVEVPKTTGTILKSELARIWNDELCIFSLHACILLPLRSASTC